jgi:hypothetical protein
LQQLEIPTLESSPADPATDGLNLFALPSHSGRQSLVSAIPLPASSSTPIAIPNGSSKAFTPDSNSDILDQVSEASEHHVPLWIKSATKMGVQFVRVAAAAKPPLASRTIAFDDDQHSSEWESNQHLTVDEYYFWITPADWFDEDDVVQNADLGSSPPGPSSAWDADRPASMPRVPSLETLLTWHPEPMVHLNWCRIHFGRFETPRRSQEGFHQAVLNSQSPQLTFSGRVADSLAFGVDGQDSFRYDMPTDTAVVIKSTDTPAVDTTSFPSPLKAYPFFIYFEPGAPLIPPSRFSIALTIAGNLRSHCYYEAALKWYESIYNPLDHDNYWVVVGSEDKGALSTATPSKVRAHSVLLEYLESLLQWADSLISDSSPLASQQASMIFNTVDRFSVHVQGSF